MNNYYGDSDQFDYIIEENLEKIIKQYSSLIGIFLIEFNSLEHELNISLVDYIQESCHTKGYMIIKKITTQNKIDLFYQFYLLLESLTEKKEKDELKNIKKQLEEINFFRNAIVHANWQTLDKNNFVRTKIIVDNESGFIKFKKVKITPKIIYKKIEEIKEIKNKIYKYQT